MSEIRVGDIVLVLPKRVVRPDFVARLGKVVYFETPEKADLADLESEAVMTDVPINALLRIDMEEWKSRSYRYIRGAILTGLFFAKEVEE